MYRTTHLSTNSGLGSVQPQDSLGGAVARSTNHSRQLRLAADLIQTLEHDPVTVELSGPALSLLAELIGCDDVSRVTLRPSVRQLVDHVCYGAADAPAQDQEQIDRLFWPAYFQTMVCRYPQLPGGSTAVLSATDLMSERQFKRSLTGELFKLQGVRHNVIVPLRVLGGVEDRLGVFRFDGPAFTEADKVMLRLLRPHLAARLQNSQQGHNPPTSPFGAQPLTGRQHEVMTLVAQGLTNHQIAQRLVLADGTVNRHLENIYTRLGVNGRVAAIVAVRANP
jgi:DNA-binding CsgD family transcriptional regulator